MFSHFAAATHFMVPSIEHQALKHCCGMYAVMMNSPGKSNPRPFTKAAGDFWNEGNGHQPPLPTQTACSFNFGPVVFPQISLDEKVITK